MLTNPHQVQKGIHTRATARVECRNQRTVMMDRYANAPLKWSRGFTDVDGTLNVYLQDVSPGWMDGDNYEITLDLLPASKLTLRTTTFGKVHPSTPDGSGAVINTSIRLDDARLCYCPEPVIPFKDAKLTTYTTITMTKHAQLFLAESWAPGRTHKNERFLYDSLTATTEITYNEQLLVWDPFAFSPSEASPESLGAWEQYSHIGSIWIIDGTAEPHVITKLIELIRALNTQTSETLRTAVSRLEGPGLSVRIAANRADLLQQQIIRIWQIARIQLWNQHEDVWTAPGEQLPELAPAIPSGHHFQE